jgi:cyanate permease
LGKQFVIAAGLFAQIKKTLALKPELALIAGLALIAVGGAIRSLSSRNAFAVGTRNAPGGMALVGERGPELVNLPRGSQVIPAAQTSNMMGGFGGSVEVFGVLRGQDIFFSNKKYGQTYGRTT